MVRIIMNQSNKIKLLEKIKIIKDSENKQIHGFAASKFRTFLPEIHVAGAAQKGPAAYGGALPSPVLKS